MEESRLKQRLVGATVLVALGVIFIPMLLSTDDEMEMPVFGSIVPERSEAISNIKHLDIDVIKKEKSKPVTHKRIPVDQKIPEPEWSKEKKSIIETIKEAASKEEVQQPVVKGTVWAVQVGSFSKKSNALGLKDKLRKKKFPAFVERIINDNKAIYRVRVGPETSRKNAERVKQQLVKEFKLGGLIVKHP